VGSLLTVSGLWLIVLGLVAGVMHFGALRRAERESKRVALASVPLPAEQEAQSPGRIVEEHRITVIPDAIPQPRIVIQVLTADGRVSSFVVGPMYAHKFSDDLLRAAAAAKRRTEDPAA